MRALVEVVEFSKGHPGWWKRFPLAYALMMHWSYTDDPALSAYLRGCRKGVIGTIQVLDGVAEEKGIPPYWR